MNEAIEVKELTKYYSDFLAVDHISFEVKQAEIFGFLGPNGAGKKNNHKNAYRSNKIKLWNLDSCRQGHDSRVHRSKKSIGVVPENSNVYDEMSALGNLIFTAKLYKVPKNEREKKSMGTSGTLRTLGTPKRHSSRFFQMYEEKTNHSNSTSPNAQLTILR
jgi:ABC-2 type transport system ATP-binding protein